MLRKFYNYFISIFLIVLISISIFSWHSPKVNGAAFTSGAKVSFTFDDGHASDLLAAQTLAANGYAATTYIVTECVGMTSAPNNCEAGPDYKYMTWQQIAVLKNTYGWEIGSHTATHASLPNISSAQLTAELKNSKDTLLAHGYDAKSLAFPYGHYNNQVLAEGAKYYTNQRRFEDTGNNIYPYNDQLIMVRGVQSGISVNKVKTYVDEAMANGYWLVLVFHEISETASTNPDDYEYTPAELDQIADYVKLKQVPVVNMAEGIVASDTNLFTNGTFSSGLSGGWTTDDPAHITADNGFHGSYPEATHSISLVAQPVAGNKHLFSPCVVVDAAEIYIFKNFLSITAITGGEISFFVDEYNTETCDNANWVSGVYKPGISYVAGASALNVRDINFAHKPSTTAVKAVRLEVIVTGNSGIKGFYDNAQMFPESAIKGNNPAPVLKTGDVNGDSFIDGIDLDLVLRNWGKENQARNQGNANAGVDTVIDGIDLDLVLRNWSKEL